MKFPDSICKNSVGFLFFSFNNKTILIELICVEPYKVENAEWRAYLFMINRRCV